MKKLILSLLLLFTCTFWLPWTAHADTTSPTHVLWTNTNGSISVWELASDGSFTHQEYGPYPGWTAKLLSNGSDGIMHILWTHSPDGQVSFWDVAADGGLVNHFEYGPIVGWTPIAISNFTLGSADFTGLIDHTKLASDPASLAQVSGGLLSNPDGFNVVVQHDLMVKGTNLYLNGNGGGLGNSNKRGLALVDGGPGGSGLILNYQNDFGGVVINGTTTFTGTQINLNGVTGAARGTQGRALLDGGPTGGGLVLNFQNDFGGVTINSDATVTNTLYAHDASISGTVTANSLQLTGGSDLAEPYKIAASGEAQPLPGMVVSIDPAQIGQMRVCTHAYDAAVGGIISGAGGVQPGITLRQKGTVADGTLPIACTGRVWCWCDAGAGGAISPGDLLTTSATPGHAMRVGDYAKAKGAILGKAMSPLQSGKGLVLVLVTLE
ncbi:MAG: hypothetical protein M3Y56_04610 [Armatimonadota bacterium]|nr:hypothetical protein [Armatimonadota bacterium]